MYNIGDAQPKGSVGSRLLLKGRVMRHVKCKAGAAWLGSAFEPTFISSVTLENVNLAGSSASVKWGQRHCLGLCVWRANGLLFPQLTVQVGFSGSTL